jgi:TetR/AcrR family transcriptional regulator
MSQSSVSEKQHAILDAAQKRFAHFGLQKVTMDEIASDLGISKAALYYYFTTKEEIFRQVIEREQQEFTDKMQQLIGQNVSSSDKLRTYILHFLDFFNELINLKLISSDNYQGLKPVLRGLFKKLTTTELELIKMIIIEGQKNGEMEIESVDEIANLIAHVLQGLRIRYYKIQFDTNDERQYIDIKSEVKLLANVLLNGIKKTIL